MTDSATASGKAVRTGLLLGTSVLGTLLPDPASAQRASAGRGWYRLQLRYDGQYLDAAHCTAPISLNPGSTFANWACQLWRLVPEAQGTR